MELPPDRPQGLDLGPLDRRAVPIPDHRPHLDLERLDLDDLEVAGDFVLLIVRVEPDPVELELAEWGDAERLVVNRVEPAGYGPLDRLRVAERQVRLDSPQGVVQRHAIDVAKDLRGRAPAVEPQVNVVEELARTGLGPGEAG